jgi:hypothetical protein
MEVNRPEITGRPTKLTKQLQEQIVMTLRMGNYIETAAAFAGLNKVTLYEWLKRGRAEINRVGEGDHGKKVAKHEEIYVDFTNAVGVAMAEAELRDNQIIYNAAKNDWKASAWRLERKYPNKWGRKEQHEITGKDGGALEINDPRDKILVKLDDIITRNEDEERERIEREANNPWKSKIIQP